MFPIKIAIFGFAFLIFPPLFSYGFFLLSCWPAVHCEDGKGLPELGLFFFWRANFGRGAFSRLSFKSLWVFDLLPE